MLRSLHIENVAVIRRLDLDFSTGFSVLTGETGAGKSIIIDSINLLLGNRVSREIIRSGENTAVVSAVFEGLSPRVCEEIASMGFLCEDASIMPRSCCKEPSTVKGSLKRDSTGRRSRRRCNEKFQDCW